MPISFSNYSELWKNDAACNSAYKPPEMSHTDWTNQWFPERGAPTAPGLKICETCPVATECLLYALLNADKIGIWGGLPERGRRRLRHQRAKVGKGDSPEFEPPPLSFEKEEGALDEDDEFFKHLREVVDDPEALIGGTSPNRDRPRLIGEMEND